MMKLKLPWSRSSVTRPAVHQSKEEMLRIVKEKWNSFNSTDRLWETGYINRAESEQEHYREGIWDFSYYILQPVVKHLAPTDAVLEIGVGLGRLAACSARAFQHVYAV